MLSPDAQDEDVGVAEVVRFERIDGTLADHRHGVVFNVGRWFSSRRVDVGSLSPRTAPC